MNTCVLHWRIRPSEFWNAWAQNLEVFSGHFQDKHLSWNLTVCWLGHAVATTCVCQFKWTLRPQTPHPPQPMCPVSSRAGATQSLPRLYSSIVLTTTYKQLQYCYHMLQQHIWSYMIHIWHRLCLLFCTIASSPCGEAKKCWGLALTCPDRHPFFGVRRAWRKLMDDMHLLR